MISAALLHVWDSLQSYEMMIVAILTSEMFLSLNIQDKSSPNEPSSSHQRVIKLSSVQTLLVIRP